MSSLQSGAQPPLVPSNHSSSSGSGALALATLIALGLLGWGAYAFAHGQSAALVTGGAVALVVVLVGWSLPRGARAGDSLGDKSAPAAILVQRLEQVESMLRTISEQQLLSDRAKAVAFREKDREALRGAIREDMGRKDWDAALVLANSMEREFGYVQEAAVLRAEIRKHHAEVIHQQVSAAVSVIDQHTKAEQWTHALREADRLGQIYPDHEHVKKLPQEIENRRQNHKKQLYESWNEAVARKDVDGSIEVLKRLDPYLTPAEAEKMQETARSIFKEKLALLKNQFSAAVHGEHWGEAVRVGDTIMRDFPNSRLAMEVKESIDTLRQRAAGRGEALAKSTT